MGENLKNCGIWKSGLTGSAVPPCYYTPIWKKKGNFNILPPTNPN